MSSLRHTEKKNEEMPHAVLLTEQSAQVRALFLMVLPCGSNLRRKIRGL